MRKIFVLLSVAIVPAWAGEHDWKVSLESGYFRPGHDLDTGIDFLSIANFHWRSVFQNASNAFIAQLKFRPEWYEKGTYSLSGSAEGQFRKRWTNGSLTLLAGYRRNGYYTPTTDVASEIGSFQAVLFKKIGARTSVEVGIPVSYVVTSSVSKTRLTVGGITVRVHRTISDRARFFVGTLTEFFRARNEDDLLANRNDGRRLGVEGNVEWLRPLFLSINYKLYRHTSDLTEPSWDHEIQCIAGKQLNDRWSVYGLIDYYRRRVKTRSGLTSTLLLTHTNNERRTSFKAAYTASPHIDLSARISYQRNELIYQSLTWSGLSLAAGIEWRR